jgi:hypothetical protein
MSTAQQSKKARRRFHAHVETRAGWLDGLLLAAFWQRVLGYCVDPARIPIRPPAVAATDHARWAAGRRQRARDARYGSATLARAAFSEWPTIHSRLGKTPLPQLRAFCVRRKMRVVQVAGVFAEIPHIARATRSDLPSLHRGWSRRFIGPSVGQNHEDGHPFFWIVRSYYRRARQIRSPAFHNIT